MSWFKKEKELESCTRHSHEMDSLSPLCKKDFGWSIVKSYEGYYEFTITKIGPCRDCGVMITKQETIPFQFEKYLAPKYRNTKPKFR